MHRPPSHTYRKLIAENRIQPDPHQAAAVEALDTLWHRLVAQRRGRIWNGLTGARPAAPRGIYLWGGVGRGKTWLMDLFFEVLPSAHKQRIHFHRFMARVHEALKDHASEHDPLAGIARQWSAHCRVLCFDEFFVSDIADAMLLAGLLRALFERGTVLVATSNVQPDDLYRDGLQRARFLPAIDLLKENTDVIEVAGGADYRLRILECTEIYHYPLDPEAERRLAEGFERISAGTELASQLDINGRSFAAARRGDGVIWFGFDELCRKARSTLDFIEIARSFNTVLLSGIPVMDDASADAVRRLVNLVDELYDHNVKLLVTAEAPAAGLYTGDRLAFEFQRTVSRLTEMQSHEYLARPHLP